MEFACQLYKYVVNKLTEDRLLEIVKEAVQIECEFITEALPCELIGMNSKNMIQYIRFVADRLIVMLGYEKHYRVENPFDFMQLLSLQGKTNFFEKKVSEYQKSSVLSKKKEDEFNLDADFWIINLSFS